MKRHKVRERIVSATLMASIAQDHHKWQLTHHFAVIALIDLFLMRDFSQIEI